MPVPYDKISIINLRARADRRREMTGELKRLGLKNHPRVETFELSLVGKASIPNTRISLETGLLDALQGA